MLSFALSPVRTEPLRGLQRVPGLVLVADSVPCRGRLVRELCAAMRCRAAHVTEPAHIVALIQRGDVSAVVAEFDAFGRRTLAEVAMLDCAMPVLLTRERASARALEAAGEVYALGLTQVTVIPRPLTTEHLQRFLRETGIMAPSREAQAAS